MDNNTKIKTCPHCGGQAFLNMNFSHKWNCWYVAVRCDSCGAQGRSYRTDKDPTNAPEESLSCKNAIRGWNMRVVENGNEECWD